MTGWWQTSVWDDFALFFSLFGVFQALACVLFPAFAIWSARHNKLAGWLGPVVLCYLCGMFLKNISLFPFFTNDLPLQFEVSDTLMSLSVPLGVSLLLFSADLMGWLRLAKKTMFSFALMVLSVLLSGSFAYWLMGHRIPEAHIVSGMLVGVYTGGTPNMTAIGLALGVKTEMFVLVNASDIILGGSYLMFLLTFAQRFFLMFLPPFEKKTLAEGEEVPTFESPFASLRLRHQVRSVLVCLALALLILGASVGVSLLMTGKLSIVAIILTVTTLGVGASFFERIRAIPGSYETGDYILLIFCVAIGTLTDLQQVAEAGTTVLMYTAIVMFGALCLHLLMAMIFRLDADTVLITSTAGIYGPVFIGPVASAMNNREVVVSGLTTGLIGYAIGTYLGIFLARLLVLF